jgi:hypothetical protein
VELADALVAVDAKDPTYCVGLVVVVDMPRRQSLRTSTTDGTHTTLRRDQRIDVIGSDAERPPVIQIRIATLPIA